MFMLALLLAAAAAAAVDGQTSNYSALCADHTMVIYPTTGSACVPLYSQAVSGAEIANIVDRHNALRRRVAQGLETLGSVGPQPAAANMRNVTWDWELAKVAQRWAAQCTFGHDKCRNVQRFVVGQNVYKKMYSLAVGTADWTAAVNAWYNEVSMFNSTKISPFEYTAPTGHYTQVVWADTTLVGCGYAYYKSALASEVTYPYVRYMVCNYGTAGNYVRQTMYKAGAPCSQCPVGTVCDAGLCR